MKTLKLGVRGFGRQIENLSSEMAKNNLPGQNFPKSDATVKQNEPG